MKIKIILGYLLLLASTFVVAEPNVSPEYIDNLLDSCSKGSSKACDSLQKIAETYAKQSEQQGENMFGFNNKKKLLRKMDGLASVAQMAVYLSQKEIYEKTMDDEKATRYSAAVSNYLFGRTADKGHLNEFTLNKIESTGNQLIANDKNIRELVIQSLRVISTVSLSIGKQEVGIEILQKYGRQFPQSPNPESYTELIQKSVESMSPYVQKSLSEM